VALRPQDTPLSERGKLQAARLGKWLYGRLPVHAPLAIFCSPFIRCVQTADAIARELEGLQREGLHSASATKICIEPGLCEDMTYMFKLKQREPWMLQPADLMCASPRVDLAYVPLRTVTHERGPVYPGGCIETTPGGTLARCNTIALELSNHPLVRNRGTALLVTHGCPSTHMVKSLCPRPGGMYLPDYADIKAGNYDGPPLQYTATTALKKDHGTGKWDLAPGFKVFSNEHDPRLKESRTKKKHKVTRYVFPEGSDAERYEDLVDLAIDPAHLGGAVAGASCTVPHPDPAQRAAGNVSLTFTVPVEYKGGDRIRVRAPRHGAEPLRARASYADLSASSAANAAAEEADDRS